MLTDEFARQELRSIAESGLLRHLRSLDSAQGGRVLLNGREFINFSSNDYLGLANSDELKAAVIEGVNRFGVGSGASRLICGNLEAHEHLEHRLACFKGTESALAFSSGYATAMGVLPALCGRDDTIILDKLSHASLIDAARLSGATLRVFPHHDLDRLASLLKGARAKSSAHRILVVTESIFSMDGDAAPLREIVDLSEAHGAWLLVDEAHAVGVLGPNGRGLIAALGLEKRVPLQMGTLGKALGVGGGYIASSRSVIDLLVNRARSLIYSTSPPPAIACAAARAVEIAQGTPGDALRIRLHAHLSVVRSRKSLLQQREDAAPRSGPEAAIIPLIVGDETAAMQVSAKLLERGFLIPAIRYPTVARGRARLRVTFSAAHEPAQIESLVACLHDLMPELGRSRNEPLQEAAP
jgi:8-amino-7-oxononanoate synthase